MIDPISVKVAGWPCKEADIALERSTELTLNPLVTFESVSGTDVNVAGAIVSRLGVLGTGVEAGSIEGDALLSCD